MQGNVGCRVHDLDYVDIQGSLRVSDVLEMRFQGVDSGFRVFAHYRVAQ